MEEFRVLVLYRSKHGTTRKYANWIADALDADIMPAYKNNSADWRIRLGAYDVVIYGGNINEVGINGLKDFKIALKSNPAKKVIYFCVGSYPASQETLDQHLNDNFKKDPVKPELYYFRGRLDFIGLGFLEKRMMSGIMKAIEKKYPEDRTEAEASILEAYYDDIDWSDKSYIQPLVNRVKSMMTPEQRADLEPRATARMAERIKIEAAEEAAWEAEMDRREELYHKNEERKEQEKIQRMSKKKRKAYLENKMNEAIAKDDPDDFIIEDEDISYDDYSEHEDEAPEADEVEKDQEE